MTTIGAYGLFVETVNVMLGNEIYLLQSADTPILLQEDPGTPDLSH